MRGDATATAEPAPQPMPPVSVGGVEGACRVAVRRSATGPSTRVPAESALAFQRPVQGFDAVAQALQPGAGSRDRNRVGVVTNAVSESGPQYATPCGGQRCPFAPASGKNDLAPPGLAAEVARGGELAVVRIVRRAATGHEVAVGLIGDALDPRAQVRKTSSA